MHQQELLIQHPGTGRAAKKKYVTKLFSSHTKLAKNIFIISWIDRRTISTDKRQSKVYERLFSQS